jgi:hypothetical protein
MSFALPTKTKTVTVVGIVTRRALDDRAEAVDAISHVCQLGREVDPDAR